MLSGHAVGLGPQVVLGGATLAQLHKRVGQSVLVSYGAPSDGPTYIKPTRLRIVGTAVLPAVGEPQSLHTSMGTGAVVPFSLIPPAFRNLLSSRNPTLNGPLDVFVRLRRGVSAAAGLASLQHIAHVGTEAFQHLPSQLYNGQFVDVLAVQYPAEIENYRNIGVAPDLLAGGLAVGAALALALALVASVRRRRRDLALLKVLGFTRAQVGQAVAWQSTISVAVGMLVGIPGGVGARALAVGLVRPQHLRTAHRPRARPVAPGRRPGRLAAGQHGSGTARGICRPDTGRPGALGRIDGAHARG